MDIAIKRAYEKPANRDGRRVLVDRLWPRGVKKEDARIDEWFREIAPSDALRKWFRHDPDKWDGFRQRYFAELKKHADLVDDLRTMAREKRLTLVYAAKDEQHNNAVALKQYLEEG